MGWVSKAGTCLAAEPRRPQQFAVGMTSVALGYTELHCGRIWPSLAFQVVAFYLSIVGGTECFPAASMGPFDLQLCCLLHPQ